MKDNRVAYWRKLAAEYHQLAMATNDPERRMRLLGAAIRCLQFAEDAALGIENPLEDGPLKDGLDHQSDEHDAPEAKDIDSEPTESL